MNREEKIICDEFLTEFKKLEKTIIAQAKLKDDYVSFSRALNQIYYNRLNPVIALRDNYDFLRTASDVRNILSHESDICVPTAVFIEKFRLLSKAIINPATTYDVCTKNVSTCTYSDEVLKVLEIMNRDSLSHIPVLDSDGYVKGIFSRSTLFDYASLYKGFEITSDHTISDLREVVDLDNHSNEIFLFVDRRMNILSAFEMISKKKVHDKNVGLLLVTEHGKKTEKLLGVITLLDLAKQRLTD